MQPIHQSLGDDEGGRHDGEHEDAEVEPAAARPWLGRRRHCRPPFIPPLAATLVRNQLTVVGIPRSLPEAISFRILSTAATSACGTFGLIFPRPTPSSFRPKIELRPPWNFPAMTSSIVRNTAWSTCFVALVSTCGPRNDWSASTPIPQTCFSFAASRVPSPQPPATWNSIDEPEAIWPSAASLHFARSTQSCEYPFSSLMPGSAFFAPAW